MKPSVIEPVDITKRYPFQFVDPRKLSIGVHQLSLINAICRLSQGIVIRIPLRTYRSSYAGINEALRILNR